MHGPSGLLGIEAAASVAEAAGYVKERGFWM